MSFFMRHMTLVALLSALAKGMPTDERWRDRVGRVAGDIGAQILSRTTDDIVEKAAHRREMEEVRANSERECEETDAECRRIADAFRRRQERADKDSKRSRERREREISREREMLAKLSARIEASLGRLQRVDVEAQTMTHWLSLRRRVAEMDSWSFAAFLEDVRDRHVPVMLDGSFGQPSDSSLELEESRSQSEASEGSAEPSASCSEPEQ